MKTCVRVQSDESIAVPCVSVRSTPLQDSPHRSGDGVQAGDVPEIGGRVIVVREVMQ